MHPRAKNVNSISVKKIVQAFIVGLSKALKIKHAKFMHMLSLGILPWNVYWDSISFWCKSNYGMFSLGKEAYSVLTNTGTQKGNRRKGEMLQVNPVESLKCVFLIFALQAWFRTKKT